MSSRTETAHAQSLNEQDSLPDADKKPKSRKPANTAFRQQRLKAWQPILTPKSVLPLFFAIGIVFAPIGGVLLWASSQVQELIIDYSDCNTQAPPYSNYSRIPSGVSYSFKNSKDPNVNWAKTTLPNGTTQCNLFFDLPEAMGPPVFLYYRLTNFYQNHRRYVQSFDIDQLKGAAVDNATISGSTCDPLTIDPTTGKAYYPCGLIANSMFNDTIQSPVMPNTGIYYMTDKGIAWASDKELVRKTSYQPWQVVPPPNWQARYGKEYTSIPNLNEDEAFQVWMRTAGLPTFSKLSLRNDTTAMAAGTYQLNITYNFPVTEYGGTKSILISTRTVMGGKNPFMGIAYIVVGGVCVILGTLFTVAHLFRPRKLGDHTYLTWNNDQSHVGAVTDRDNRIGVTSS